MRSKLLFSPQAWGWTEQITKAKEIAGRFSPQAWGWTGNKMTKEKPNPFTLIKHAGEPNYATFEGIRVKREERLFIREWGAFVNCTPYDNHFVFEVPHSRKRNGLSEYLCTCGSPAVVVNPENVRGRLFACYFEVNNGYHQTSIINKKDFSNIAGETITLPEGGKKWLI